MQLAYLLCGGSAVYKKYKMAAAIAAGVIGIRTAANATGVSTSTTTSTAKAIGLIVDSGLSSGASITYSTTQGQPEAVFTFLINPDAVFRLLMNGGATDGTALASKTTTSASSTGLVITTGFDYSNPTMDEGMSWCVAGANVGQSRKITSVGSTAATVIMPYLNGIAIGDVFCHAPYFPGAAPKVQLTSNLKNADASIAVGTGATLSIVDLELNGTTDSYLHAMNAEHIFSGGVLT